MEFKKSTHKGKKYMIFYGNKFIHFGDINYSQFYDSTPLKLYSHLNHNDEKRRKSYLARAKGIKDKNGNLTYKNKNSPNYWSVHWLW